MHRTWGGILAGALFVLPSLFILVGLSWVYVAFGQVDWVAGLFYGIKPAVSAIVLQAVWRIGSRTLRSPRRVPWLWVVAVSSFVAIAILKIPFPWVVLGAGLVGAWGGKYVPAQFDTGGGHAGTAPRRRRGIRADSSSTMPRPRPNMRDSAPGGWPRWHWWAHCCGSCRWAC